MASTESLPKQHPCWGELGCPVRGTQDFSHQTRPINLEDSRNSANSTTQDCRVSKTNHEDSLPNGTENDKAEKCTGTDMRRRKKSYGDGCEVELPPGTAPLPHQVAGHRRGPGSMVMLKCDGGHVLKHVQRPPKGHREVEFYRRVFDAEVSDPVLLSLRPFIPAFHGTLPEGPVDTVTFFKMSDVTERFVRPCISDIKMGKLTYDPLATEEKRMYELAKYPPGINLGIQMLGMRVYDKEQQKFDVYDRKYGRSLKEDQVLEKGLGVYFGGPARLRKDAVRCMLGKLCQIQAWFESQCQLAFYASSLLLLYEGGEPSSSEGTHFPSQFTYQDSCSVCQQACVADVKMIDFAHVFQVTDSDENYLLGLRTLIALLQKLL